MLRITKPYNIACASALHIDHRDDEGRGVAFTLTGFELRVVTLVLKHSTNRVDAIKLLRTLAAVPDSLGLREAKFTVDALADMLGRTAVPDYTCTVDALAAVHAATRAP